MVPLLIRCDLFYSTLFIIKTLSLYKDKNLFAVIQQLLGKYHWFCYLPSDFVINSSAISLDSRSYTNIIRSFYFTTTPNVIIYAILMSVCAYGAKKGIQHIGSVAWIVFFYASVSFISCLIIMSQDSNIQSIFPILGPGKLEILKQSTLKTNPFRRFFSSYLTYTIYEIN